MEQKSDSFEWSSRPEVFNFGRHAFDVEKAKELIRTKKPRKVSSMNISGVVDLVGEPPKADGSFVIRALGVVINWDRVQTDEIDTDVPLILVPFQDSYLPIDGWHRIAKAKIKGTTTLKCVVLNKSETKLIGL
jgi:hypothetical protein